MVVTDALERLILGIDWLSTNGCQWDFGAAKLHLNGHAIPVYRRPSRAVVRRIYVAEEHTVAPGHQGHLAVKVVRKGLRDPVTDWLYEPKCLRNGVVAARTLMSGDATNTSIRVLNHSEFSHRFRAGQYLGSAEPAQELGPGDFPAESQSAAALYAPGVCYIPPSESGMRRASATSR